MRHVCSRPVSAPRQVASDDRSALWALLTFYGGACQLHLDRTCTHLVVPEPKGVSARVPAPSVPLAARGPGPWSCARVVRCRSHAGGASALVCAEPPSTEGWFFEPDVTAERRESCACLRGEDGEVF